MRILKGGKGNMKDKMNRWLEFLEGIGVGMRIFSFGTLSLLGPQTPFLLMWIVNTLDAVLLTWCAYKRGNRPYILLNTFWFVVGVVGIWTSIYGVAKLTH